MFKFGRKDKSKGEEKEKKKERRDSKKEKKQKDVLYDRVDNGGGADEERYTHYPPPVAPKPSTTHSSSLSGVNLHKNGGKSAASRGILKIKSSLKKSSYSEPPPVHTNLDDPQVLLENTRRNEEIAWRTSLDNRKPTAIDRKKRESIHSITMAISPPSVPPPASATEKVYDVDLELPQVNLPRSTQNRELSISRQPRGDFGFNLRWAPYHADDGVVRQVVHAEPGSSGVRSGVIAGDRIIEINGQNVERTSKEEVISLIQKSADPLRLLVKQLPEVSELSSRTEGTANGVLDDEGNIYDEVAPPAVNGHSISPDKARTSDRFWLVHRGGYSTCELIPQRQTTLTDTIRCKVRLEQGGHILEVDENDLEKINPASLDRCENLSSLSYLNESSILHVLRQRYGSSLIHTVAGPSLLIINPNHSLNVHSHKVMQLVRGFSATELPPHVYSQAHTTYQCMLNTGKDQTIVLAGRSGSGKTTSMKHILSYYSHAYGGLHSSLLDEKVAAASVILESLGNCSTRLNKNASRCTQHVTVEFDSHGLVTSVLFQVWMLEKSRIVRVNDGESPFHIFNLLLHGADSLLKQELQLHSNSAQNSPYCKNDKELDKDSTVSGWYKLEQAMKTLDITADESRAVYHILAAIIHLSTTGVQKGANNKTYFSDAMKAQTVCKLLGVTMEDLYKYILTPSSSTSSSKSNMRFHTDDLSSSMEALEGFMVGLYSELLNVLLALINRSLSSVTRNANSITILDTPGFRPNTAEPAGFDDLCYNYLSERLQLLFHEKIFTENHERYAQENIDIEKEEGNNTPEMMVSLMDKCTDQQLLQSTSSSRMDISLLGREDDDDSGLLWLLDQYAITPGSTEQEFLDKLSETHGDAIQQCERLVIRHPQQPELLTLNHSLGTSPVTYNTTGWMKACRNHPSSEQAAPLLNSSQRAGISELFTSRGGLGGSMISSMTSSTSGLRRNNSMRRMLANQAGIKRRSLALILKYQTDSLMEMINKTGVHFVFHLLPQSVPSSNASGDMVLDVPSIRTQIRGIQLLPAIRYYRQGYPEHMTFGDFITRYALLSQEVSRQNVPLMDQKSYVEGIITNVSIDKSQYKIGVSQVFLRPAAMAQLDRQRELRRSLHAVIIQKHIRRYLAQKAILKLRLKHEAMRCVQKNVRIHFKLRDWQWWKLYTKIKPLVNVQKTEEDLKVKEAELQALKAQLEKSEAEKLAFKKECAKLEDEVALLQSDYTQEKNTARQAVELLEQETSNRLSVEAQLLQTQNVVKTNRTKIQILEQENDDLRTVHQNYDDTHSEFDDMSTALSQQRYEHMVKENEMKRRQLQTEFDDELQRLQDKLHKTDRQCNEAVIEREELTTQLHNFKKKVQKLSNEAQDYKLQLEDCQLRNTDLEKRQRKFDNELHIKAGDIAGERNMRDHLQKERDQLLKQKYLLTQQLEDISIERDNLVTKLRRLEHEMTELKSSGTHGDSELIQLRSQVHDLERKLAEAEDEIGDLQQEAHDLEMTKLKSQLELDKIKQRNQKEVDQLERDLEEQREAATRKSRSYESRITELDEELHAALQGKRDAERRMLELRDQAPSRDMEHEREMKSVIKRLRALLSDAQGQIEKNKEQASHKSQIRALETQLEDVRSVLTSALKTKQSLETDLADCQKQLSSVSKGKSESEDKLGKLQRDKNDIENEKEDLEEEIHELLKRYQSLVSQNQVTHKESRDMSEEVSSLKDSKQRLQEEVDTLNSRVAHLNVHHVPKEKLAVLESKILELEQKFDYEKSVKVRFENLSSKYKDNAEKHEDEINRLQSKLMEEDRKYKQLQSQLSRALEGQEDVNRKDIEQSQTIANLNSRLELCDSQIHQLQGDLKSAEKRAEGLRIELEQASMMDDEDEEFSSDSEDGYS